MICVLRSSEWLRLRQEPFPLDHAAASTFLRVDEWGSRVPHPTCLPVGGRRRCCHRSRKPFHPYQRRNRDRGKRDRTLTAGADEALAPTDFGKWLKDDHIELYGRVKGGRTAGTATVPRQRAPALPPACTRQRHF